jgi:hypothetical protein
MLFSRQTEDAACGSINAAPASTWLLELLEIQREYLDPLMIAACQASGGTRGKTPISHEVSAAIRNSASQDLV